MVKLVEARGLAHEYPGGVRALAGVDFSLAVGELAVVLGPNGSGKSTLLKLLSGLVPCRAGRIELRGRELGHFTIRERARHVAVVPQFLPALPSLSVVDFVLGGRYAHRVGWRHSLTRDREVVERSLAACDALDLASRAMDELSGGQRQRVLLARALAQEAEILLVDEPTNSLDPEHQVRVFALLSELAREGRGACVVTHDLNLAAQFATRLTLLDAGRVAAEGTVDAVLRPEVLAPVYGEHLYYGRFDDPGRAGGPFVLPRLRRS